MFRITTIDDDRHSPMNGVATVSSLAEALAIVEGATPEDEGDTAEGELLSLVSYGGSVTLYSDGCEYIVERIA
jgi:hypothetical protein